MSKDPNHWKNNKAFVGSTNYVEHEVNGVTLKFYPVSVTTMFSLKKIAAPLAGALSVLFKPRPNDYAIVEKTFKDSEGGGREVANEAINPELAKVRSAEWSSAVEKLILAVADQENAGLLAKLIMDSLRDVFPRTNRDNPPPAEFADFLEGPAFSSCLLGVAKANKDVLGPLADRAQERLEALGAVEKAEAQVKAPTPLPETVTAG